jgi:imidazolonepropionase-like amidohydrolase
MKNKITLLLFASVFSLTTFGQIYVTNVTVVDVENKKLIPEQTVVVTNDIISVIKPVSKIKIPYDAKIINGLGKYLIPGLTDAHVHFFQSGGLYTRPDALDLRKYSSYEKEINWVHNNMEDFLRRYMQMGITSVIDVGATYNFLKQRDSFANKSYSPTIYMTGPLLTSYEPDVFKNLKNDEPFKLFTSIEDAKKMVLEQLPFHPDFIKIWYIVNPDSAEASAKKYQPIVKAIIEESHKNNLKVAVHATERITAQLAVESGCDYLVHDIEDEVVSDDFIKLLKTKNIILCPTLTVMDGYNNTFGQKHNFSFFDLIKSNPEQIGSLNDLKHLPDTTYFNQVRQWINSPKSIANSIHADSIKKTNLKKMSDAGVIIVAGTDAGNIGTQHATSFLNELKAMEKSGLTNWQIIQSATINPTKLFNKENNTGSISIGKKADMVLLNANPIDSLENLAKIDLVFNKGYAIKPDTLINETPLALVQRQLNAYNARNIDAFLEPYSDDVELYMFPDKLLSKGKENMRKDYNEMFKNLSDLHCEIKERIIQSNIIIDKESVSGMGKTKLEATAIYHIEHNKITKVFFIQ